DAVAAISTPVVEVHISDIYKREKFRHHSFLKKVCVKSIVGKFSHFWSNQNPVALTAFVCHMKRLNFMEIFS
ncbi:MAG TPA: type II 3-dehydroquinate dehydratase, partial [Chromatiaceae bacterium]|nr:type II 3-dehydroquinate dehydratase [Chromatiaceae bacterium]